MGAAHWRHDWGYDRFHHLCRGRTGLRATATSPEQVRVGGRALSSLASTGVAAETAGAGERTVLSGHGWIEAGDESVTTIPEGTCVSFYCAHGETISDSLGNSIETGHAPTPVEVARGGDVVPDYYLGPPDGLTIKGNPTTVETPTRLSDLLRENMGACDWAACRDVG